MHTLVSESKDFDNLTSIHTTFQVYIPICPNLCEFQDTIHVRKVKTIYFDIPCNTLLRLEDNKH